jgi:3-hydroxyisobutyrate dehydrogenase
MNMHIGIAGTGKMGHAIASRLIAEGFMVSVWNRTVANAKDTLALGSKWCKTPKILAQSCDMVLSIVSDFTALKALYDGDEGLIAGAKPNQILVDMSTIAPHEQQAMGKKFSSSQAFYLECPVGGSTRVALQGQLIGFMAGSKAVADEARTVLTHLTKRLEHVGDWGSGATMKLAINLPLMVYWQTLGEALSLIEPLGLDPQLVVDLFTDSSGGPNMLKVRGKMIAQALANHPSTEVTVNLSTMRKDVNTMLAFGKTQGKSLPVTQLTLASLSRACEEGWAQKDCTQMLTWWLTQNHT